MANKPLKSIKFPGLPDTYTIPQVDSTPTQDSPNAVQSGGVKQVIDGIKDSVDNLANVCFTDISLTFISGGITNAGGPSTSNARIRTLGGDAPLAVANDFVIVDKAYEAKIAAYSTNAVAVANYIGSTSNFVSGVIKIPDGYVGCYIALTIRKVGYESADISGDVATIQNYVSYKRGDNILEFKGDATTIGYTTFSDIKKTGVYQIKKEFVNTASDTPVVGTQTAGGYLIVIQTDNATFQSYNHKSIAVYSRYLIGNNPYPWKQSFVDNDTKGGSYSFSDITDFGATIALNTMFRQAADSPEPSNSKGGVILSIPFGTKGVVQVVHSINGNSYIRVRGSTSDTFGDWVTLRSSYEPWKSLRVSMLGDSISTFAGYIPTENVAYYSGSNHGVTNVNQMWWYNAIINNGATPLILDAWSGSLVCKDVRQPTQSNSYKPMSNPDRCQHLHGYIEGTQDDYDIVVTSENIESIRVSPFDSYTPAVGDYAKRIDPDIILMTGGGNDYSYNAPIGTWDGHTDLDPTALSTFREAYANTLNLIREEYPNALVICIKPWFFVRPGFSTLDKNQVNRNNLGLTYKDYFDVIEEIAGLMACPVVDGFTNGFNRYNYYNTFCTDASNNPTHPTGLGQKIMGKNLATQMKPICAGYVQWLKGDIT